MNRLLTNINKLPVTAKHLSSKFNLNQVADLQSRYTPPCNVTSCSIHRFIDEVTKTVIDPAARCSSFTIDTSFSNRQAWKIAQQNSDSCKAAIAHLTTGKVPHNKPGDQHNEMRHYIRHASLAPDGLLITAGDSHIFTPGEPKNKVIIPNNIAPGILYHQHNKSPGQHLSMS